MRRLALTLKTLYCFQFYLRTSDESIQIELIANHLIPDNPSTNVQKMAEISFNIFLKFKFLKLVQSLFMNGK